MAAITWLQVDDTMGHRHGRTVDGVHVQLSQWSYQAGGDWTVVMWMHSGAPLSPGIEDDPRYTAIYEDVEDAIAAAEGLIRDHGRRT